MLINNIQIGGDPELFLREKETGKIITAEGIVKGTKSKPFNFDPEDEFACTSLDCVLAEFNIKPAKTKAEYYYGIEKALKYLNSTIPNNLEVVALPAARLESDQLITSIANTFGCSTDRNVWTDSSNPRPRPMGNLRSAGCHITLGYDNPNKTVNSMWVKAMDLFLSVPSVIQEPMNERKALYGKAGAYRQQKWGAEYRSLSNYVLSTKELIEWTYDNTIAAVNFVNEGNSYMLNDEADIIIDAINNNNEEKALYLIDKFKIKLAA